jgi:hypothetical protein
MVGPGWGRWNGTTSMATRKSVRSRRAATLEPSPRLFGLASELDAAIAGLDAATLRQSRSEEQAFAEYQKLGIGIGTARGERIARRIGVDRAEAEADQAAARFDRIAGKVLRSRPEGLNDLVLKTRLLDLVDDRVLLRTLINDVAALTGTRPPKPRLKED